MFRVRFSIKGKLNLRVSSAPGNAMSATSENRGVGNKTVPWGMKKNKGCNPLALSSGSVAVKVLTSS